LRKNRAHPCPLSLFCGTVLSVFSLRNDGAGGIRRAAAVDYLLEAGEAGLETGFTGQASSGQFRRPGACLPHGESKNKV